MIRLRCYCMLLLCLSPILVGTGCNSTDGAEFSNAAAQENAVTQEAVTASRRTAIVTAVAKASPAVVNISAIRTVEQLTLSDEWFQRFWGEIPYRRRRLQREVGSGVIIDKKGYILTNHHVIENADSITVTVPDGREFTAHVAGYDYLSDLAVLEINTDTTLPEIQWGDSDALLIGEWVVAIGNPFGLSIGDAQPSVTIGIVSATQRSRIVENFQHENLIQTDASINPGNSGGALVNIHGELIGINTVIHSTSGGSQGVGFAIPANKAQKVVEQIIEYGSVVPPDLAIEVQEITEDLAEKLSIPMNTGVLVSEIEKRSPIANAGIRRGDVITSISGHRVKSEADFYPLTRLLPINERIKCEFSRRGKNRQTEFKIKTRQWSYKPPGWGITFAQPDKDMARKYQIPGVIITHVDRDSRLKDALKRGDLIYQIDDTSIYSLEILKLVDENIRSQYRTLLYFERDGVRNRIPIFFNRNDQRR
ncbi:PDZ domain-containing protein [Candidatus Poribacteria bacterium]|nr:PDZ domain-containing protein [Candidatus Poribacteria bacterium]